MLGGRLAHRLTDVGLLRSSGRVKGFGDHFCACLEKKKRM